MYIFQEASTVVDFHMVLSKAFRISYSPCSPSSILPSSLPLHLTLSSQIFPSPSYNLGYTTPYLYVSHPVASLYFLDIYRYSSLNTNIQRFKSRVYI